MLMSFPTHSPNSPGIALSGKRGGKTSWLGRARSMRTVAAIISATTTKRRDVAFMRASLVGVLPNAVNQTVHREKHDQGDGKDQEPFGRVVEPFGLVWIPQGQ